MKCMFHSETFHPPFDSTQYMDTDTTSNNAQSPRNLKKRKTSNKKSASNGGQPTRKGKKGNVTHDVPFDVLLEISRLLEPIDLLHLSRVSKSLYASLTSNKVTWQLAYENVPSHRRPPLCPDDTNIVSYTNFLYGRHCQFCASIYGRIYHESVFLRLCLKCANKSFIKPERGDLVSTLCNRWSFPKCKGLGTSNDRGILKEEYDLRLKEFKQAHKTKTVEPYVEARTIATKNRSSVASDLSLWRQKRQVNQIDTLKVIRQKREADIRNKLKEEGFEADSDSIGYYWVDRVPHARKPQPLTNLEWSLIRADILDFFQGIREEKVVAGMEREFRCLIRKLEQFILQWKIRPTAWWIASLEPIASFMKSESEEKEFKVVESEIRNIITSWQEETDRYLATLIPRPSRKGKKNTSNSDTAGLELATTSFKCHWCTEPIIYPRILMHACLLRNKGGESDVEDVEEDAVVDPRTRGRGPRQPRPPIKITLDTVLPTLSGEYSLGMFPGRAGVTFHKEAFKSAQDIITICGEDPNTVTHAALEGSATRLECLRCSRAMQEKSETKSDRLVMKWDTAIIHELEEHNDEPSSSEPVWHKIDSEEDLDKIEGEESYMKTMQKHQGRRVFGKHCPLADVSIKMLYPAVKI